MIEQLISCGEGSIPLPELQEMADFIVKAEENEDIYKTLTVSARTVTDRYYGDAVYLRGLIEFTNCCKNDCYYCGIRRGNQKADRYRLSREEILHCCRIGYKLGFRTFVLQGGEDPAYSADDIARLVYDIKQAHPDCAITLSIGEHSKEDYELWFEAGADRYLLRHETANDAHYRKLHPEVMSLSHRKQCLYDLKEIGYQIGSGFMVGSPYQTKLNLAEDIAFLYQLQPHMIGIGPYITHKDTPFSMMPSGTVKETIVLLAMLRLLFPKVLLPATTALGTMAPNGREQGLAAGANVIMPNLSPVATREKYSLYDNKICTGEEAAECKICMDLRVQKAGLRVVADRGDSLSYQGRPAQKTPYA